MSILTMNGGNGTMSASMALRDYLESKDALCYVTDFMKEANPLGARLAGLYNLLLKGDLRLATWYMEMAHLFPVNDFAPFNIISRKRTLSLLDKEKPDAIVIICPWIIDAVLHALKSSSKRPKIYTVVVDLGEGITPSWYNGQVDLTVLPTRHARDYLYGTGVLEGRYEIMGMPLAPELLNNAPSRDESLELLGAEAPLCTVMGGREGGRNSLRIVDMLLRESNDANILIQCGTNKKLAKAAERRRGVKVVGFLESIIPLYKASDVVITKPGALTVSELITLKKPFILDTHPVVMPQERGNVKLVREEGLGLVAGGLGEIPELVNRVLDDEIRFPMFEIYGTDRIGDMILSEGQP